MSIKDLKEMGILLPEDKWGQFNLETSLDKPRLFAAVVLGLVSAIAIYVGNGGTLTWVGVGLYFVFVFWLTRIFLKGVEVQNKETEAFLGSEKASSE